MAAIFSLFLAIFAHTAIHFTHDATDKTKNDTMDGFSLKSVFRPVSVLWLVLGHFLAVEVEALMMKIHMTLDQADGICFPLWITMPYFGMTYNGQYRKKSHSFQRTGMKMKNWYSLGTPFRRSIEETNSQQRLALPVVIYVIALG